ncbi:hypothetical protein KY495_06635 [Massilia sp. PAMC28688]|uniref:hypothetical protein n=1 Tax=Massilia sp. PAMC28688 TaxID=2861283 RepID=UPI001C636FDC|nr:hypothetical protein [Massilia sp. PAMC28688]QYF94855.1 hypothetical protein KY495_06635 [Massilia sp. PAMC28688]
MRRLSIATGLTVALLTSSCGGGGGPTEQDINNSLNATLQSVAGDWTGIVNGPNAIRLEFRLQEGSNGQVSGTGTMKEESAPAAVPITVTGTFQRPALTLVFDGMVYETRQVKGSAQGNYTTVGGIGTTLTMTAPGYSRDVQILLQEK